MDDNLDREEDMDNKEIAYQTSNNIKFKKHILVVFFLFLLIVYKIFTGEILLESIFKYKSDPARDYNFSFQDLFNRLYDLRDYFITFAILIVITYYISEKNREWEIKFRSNEIDKENKYDKKHSSVKNRKLSLINEDKEGENTE